MNQPRSWPDSASCSRTRRFKSRLVSAKSPEFLAATSTSVERSLLWISELLNAEVLFLVPDEETAGEMSADGEAVEPEIIGRPLRGKPHERGAHRGR